MRLPYNLVNRKFGFLTVLNKVSDIIRMDGKKFRVWFCICDCGNSCNIKECYLLNGDTKSCGCLSAKQSSINIRKAVSKNTKFLPYETSARKTYHTYIDRFPHPNNITFDQFLELSQKNCFYCNAEPYNISNSSSKKSSAFFRENADFTYNGLDRVDNNVKAYLIDNVVACCRNCNIAKRDRTVEEFICWVRDIKTNFDKLGLK